MHKDKSGGCKAFFSDSYRSCDQKFLHQCTEKVKNINGQLDFAHTYVNTYTQLYMYSLDVDVSPGCLAAPRETLLTLPRRVHSSFPLRTRSGVSHRHRRLPAWRPPLRVHVLSIPGAPRTGRNGKLLLTTPNKKAPLTLDASLRFIGIRGTKFFK